MEIVLKKWFKQVFRIWALLLCIFFFVLPLVRCSENSSLNATGYQIATGTGDLYDDSGENGDPLVFVLLFIPVVLLIMAFLSKSYKPLRNGAVVGLIAKIGFITAASIKLGSEEYSGTFELTGYNWFITAVYIGLICLAQIGIKKEISGEEKIE